VRGPQLSYQNGVLGGQHSMARVVGIGVILFVVAVGFIVVTQAQDIAALFEAFRSEPLSQKLAWFLAVLIPLALIPSALWLCDALARQRKANAALELRLGGVRDGVKDLARTQVDADAAVHHLARTDPEEAIGAVAQRLTEAERVAQIQQNRSEIGDLQTRVEELRAQQQGLRERLAPVLEKRRSIEQIFAELDSRENDIDQALGEIASGDDATAIQARLAGLMDFVRRSHERCDEIEHASKTVAGLKQDFIDLRGRLDPYAAASDGVARRLKDVTEAHDQLAADLDALQQTPQGGLAARVQAFADGKKKLDDGVANLDLQFSKLATLGKDIDSLYVNLDHALDVLAMSDKAAADGADARVAEVSEFIKGTQARFDGIERNMVTFGQLKTKLDDLQTRLMPLESKNGGIADLLSQVQDIRDRLMARIEHLETDGDGDLATRVNTLIEAKQELEKRVATVTEHFSQLATIRNDIAGLFDKLSSAADTH
jgi:DNA repair exonuclease SbcCD ATPase subunit